MTFEMQVMYQAKTPLLGNVWGFFFSGYYMGIAFSVYRNGIVKYMLNTDLNHSLLFPQKPDCSDLFGLLVLEL